MVLDLDSSDSPTHSRQEGSAYNGHFGYTCYHPLFCLNQLGDLLGAMLRRGNVHSANEWQALLNPIVEQYRPPPIPKFFRGDAAFAIPELYAYLEAEAYSCAIRLKANNVLRRHIARLMQQQQRPWLTWLQDGLLSAWRRSRNVTR